MMNPAQVSERIRFALEQLSERNGEYEWEHLCRNFASARICSNILPATGPVQAGGDQGRDFETFHTFLKRSPLAGRAFVGLISEQPIAFACTLQKDLAPKIRADVTTIMSSGTKVESIYIFCSRGIDVAKRHKVQEWARTEHGVSVEIFDGAAMATLLANEDVFWLAVRYLDLPADLIPMHTEDADKDWYTTTLNKWRLSVRPAQTFADFTEIRAAAREALGPFRYGDDGEHVDQYDKVELPFWIERLDEIARQDTVKSLRRRAVYEASVLRLRGLGSLIGQEETLRRYFDDIPELTSTADLEDAGALLSYCQTATYMGKVATLPSEVETWLVLLENRLGDQLRKSQENDHVNEQCAILEIQGNLALIRHVSENRIHVTDAFRYWDELVKLVVHAPLFPLERFNDRLVQSVAWLGMHPAYGPLSDAVDALVAKRLGQRKVAENCLERAKELRKAGNLPLAMAQLHRAKIDWFTEETLGKSMLAINWLHLAYEEQGLYFAAKYYSLVAAFVIVHSDDLRLKPLIAHALKDAASCDYGTGAWNGFLDLAKACAIFYPHYARDPESDSSNDEDILQNLIFHLSLLVVTTKHLHPVLETFAHEQSILISERVNFDDVLSLVQDKANQTWEDKGAQELRRAIERQLAGPPWSDAGPLRRTQWRAHGLEWRVEWANDYETTLATEGFLAVLQIFLSDLAGYDLCLMRSVLNISVQLSDEYLTGNLSESTGYRGFNTFVEPSNVEVNAVVTLPPYRHFQDGILTRDDLTVGALSVVSRLLGEVSLLPLEQFDKILDDRFAQGLHSKLLIGAPYQRCLSEFVIRTEFDNSERAAQTPLIWPTPFVPQNQEGLRWFDGPGPGYDPELVPMHLRNRYERFSQPIFRTVQRLARESEFQGILVSLRADGWKDWHILAAIFHVTLNYRINNYPFQLPSKEAFDALSKRLISEPEPEDALHVPLHEYTEEKLREQLIFYMGAFAKTAGLELHQLTPNLRALDDFLNFSVWVLD